MHSSRSTVEIHALDVLTYLNTLGYVNISAQHLKEFLTDLKKLIKYARKQRINADYTVIDPLYNDQRSYKRTRGASQPKPKKDSQKQTERDISSLLNEEEPPPRPKSVNDCNDAVRTHQILLHVLKKINKEHEHCIHFEENIQDNNIVEESTGAKLEAETELTAKSTQTTLKPSSSQKPLSHSKRTSQKSSAKSVKGFNKCDPVALYHHYQAEWKKQKFPGQEDHASLRRTVREKLRSDTNVAPRSTSSRRRCYN